MWNILKSVGVALRLVNDSEEIDQRKEESDLLKILEAEDSDGDVKSEIKINNSLSDLSSHRVGHITHFNQDNNGGMIDSLYYFDIKNAPSNIRIGDRVMYTAYRKDTNSIWIVKNVYGVQNDEWKINNGDIDDDISGEQHGNENNTDDNDGGNNGGIEDENIVGKVVKRNGRQLVIEPGNHICHLDKVATNFVPIEGDWLLLKCVVQVNNESLNSEVLQIESLMPLRSRIQNGKVSHWESQFNQGIIDSEIVFSLDACDHGYIPVVGDEVIADIIESEQGMLVWRALQVFPFLEEGKRDKNRKKQKDDSEIPNENLEDDTKGKAMVDIVIQNEKEHDLYVNKSGICITMNCNFGEVYLGDDKELVVYVKNETNRTHQLLSATFKSNRLKCDRNPQIKLISPNLKISDTSNREHYRPFYINGHDCTKFVFRATPRYVGKTSEVFIWKFKGFEIGRRITFDVVNSYISNVKNSEVKRFKSNVGDITTEKIFATRNGFIVSSEKRFRPAAFIPVRLGIFPVPQRLWECVLKSETSSKSERQPVSVRRKIEEAMPCLSEPLNKNNYKQRWHAILYLEEIAHTVCLRQYDMPRAHFTKNGDYLVLEVPGLSEKRPSLICGDNIIIRNPCTVSMEDDVKYEGNIHRIYKNEIWVKFNKAFHDCYSGNDYEVLFSLHRVGFRRCHQAINITFDHLLGDWLFPNCLKQSEPQIIPIDENDSDITTDSAKEKDENIDDNSKNSLSDTFDNEFINSNLNTTLKSPQINDVNKDSWKPNKSPRSATRLSVVERLKLSLLDNNIDNANNLSSASTTNQPGNFNSTLTVNNESNDQKYNEKSINLNKLFENMNSVNKCNDELNKTLPIKTVEEIEKDFLSVKNNNSNNSDDNSVSIKETCDNSVTSTTSSDIDNNTNKTEQSSSEYRIKKNIVENVKFLPWVKSVVPDIAKDGHTRTVKKCCQRKIKWFNPRLNHFQKEAVKNILIGEARPLPYIIFGPPGTGKTITLVEAALQLLDLIPDSRLLIATPSNSSANLVCERLIDSGSIAPGVLSRLCSFNYMADENQNISDKLFPYCTTAEIRVVEQDLLELANFNKGIKSSSREVLGRHRVTVGTCVSLGILYNMGFAQGHFTHILIDEAGQATEPELLIPLAFLDDKYGQAILAGDPMQLGPIVQSTKAIEYGMQDSFLFRLLLSFPFTRDVVSFPETCGFDPRVITRLVINYRSLPEILALPSSMFYDSSLISQVSEVDSEEAKILLKLKDVLPSRTSDDGEDCEYKLPPALVFHGVRGVNFQEADSPSWFNPQEIVQVIFYINVLYKIGLTPEQVGIVTPYKKQVMKIRSSLKKLEIPLPKIGSVEEFQGQERMAIILSTVRSSSTFISHDIKHSLGFVSSPRRLNVALTRGRAIVIVLGNPHLLNSDPHWRTVLKYCIKNKSYCGCDLPAELEE